MNFALFKKSYFKCCFSKWIRVFSYYHLKTVTQRNESSFGTFWSHLLVRDFKSPEMHGCPDRRIVLVWISFSATCSFSVIQKSCSLLVPFSAQESCGGTPNFSGFQCLRCLLFWKNLILHLSHHNLWFIRFPIW